MRTKKSAPRKVIKALIRATFFPRLARYSSNDQLFFTIKAFHFLRVSSWRYNLHTIEIGLPLGRKILFEPVHSCKSLIKACKLTWKKQRRKRTLSASNYKHREWTAREVFYSSIINRFAGNQNQNVIAKRNFQKRRLDWET